MNIPILGTLHDCNNLLFLDNVVKLNSVEWFKVCELLNNLSHAHLANFQLVPPAEQFVCWVLEITRKMKPRFHLKGETLDSKASGYAHTRLC